MSSELLVLRADPASGGARSARDVVAGLELRAREVERRPRVAAVMIASADGHATIAGRSVALGHPADRGLLRELRTAADAILVGARTLSAERYANLLDPEQREQRVAAGLRAHPLVVTVSRALDLDATVPLLHESGVEVIVATESAAPAPGAVERFEPGSLTMEAVLGRLAARGVRVVACEGGPSLLRRLVVERCLDDLLLTIAPLAAGGDGPRVLEGPAFELPARLTLASVHRADDHLFLHYRA